MVESRARTSRSIELRGPSASFSIVAITEPLGVCREAREADHAFFRRAPDRLCRVRPALATEIDYPAGADDFLFVVVHRECGRRGFIGYAGCPLDDEASGVLLWDYWYEASVDPTGDTPLMVGEDFLAGIWSGSERWASTGGH